MLRGSFSGDYARGLYEQMFHDLITDSLYVPTDSPKYVLCTLVNSSDEVIENVAESITAQAVMMAGSEQLSDTGQNILFDVLVCVLSEIRNKTAIQN